MPYQREWILNDAKRSIYVKSRRIGITWAEAFWSVRRRLKHRIDHVFCSKDEKTGREFINYAKRFAEAVNVMLQSEYIDLNGITTEILPFPNGARIIVVSSSPTALRGLGGDCTLDEFDWHEDQDALYTAAGPVVQWGGCLRLISTLCPSDQTVFSTILKDPAKYRFARYQTPLPDAVEQGLAEMVPGEHQKLLPDIEAARREFVADIRESCISEGMYKQEYLCQHSDQQTIISGAAYDRCVIPGFAVPMDGVPDLSKCGAVYMGIDVARSGDATVITLLEQGEDIKAPPKRRRVYRTIFIRVLHNMPFAAQFEVIASILHNQKIKKCFIESNGIGAQLAEQCENAFPGRAYAWISTANSKATAIERYAGWVHQERIGLSPDAKVKADITALQRVVSPAGKVSYDGRSELGHCDSFVSGAVALEAAEGEQTFFTHGVVGHQAV